MSQCKVLPASNPSHPYAVNLMMIPRDVRIYVRNQSQIPSTYHWFAVVIKICWQDRLRKKEIVIENKKIVRKALNFPKGGADSRRVEGWKNLQILAKNFGVVDDVNFTQELT